MRGWTMRCGPFEADIRRQGSGPYHLTINKHPILHGSDLTGLMRRAEEELVRRIEAVLPAFEIVKARLASRQGRNVVPMKPRR
jgi:hypothetical protein